MATCAYLILRLTYRSVLKHSPAFISGHKFQFSYFFFVALVVTSSLESVSSICFASTVNKSREGCCMVLQEAVNQTNQRPKINSKTRENSEGLLFQKVGVHKKKGEKLKLSPLRQKAPSEVVNGNTTGALSTCDNK